MASFEAGSYVWIPDEKEQFLPARVVKSFKSTDAAGTVKVVWGPGADKELTLDGKKTKECLAMDEAALATYDNMIQLNDLNEPTILHNLRQRFLKDGIYTYVSSILVACNPFKLLPIYTPEVLDKYKDRGSRTQPPHIFAIADNAYANLQADFRDQAVVISGESGAGKTETMKLVLQFLAEASGRAQKASSGGEKTESLEQQILKSNPLMEAFGNAKTTRNNNSSRFGKWTEIKFNRQGAIVGGSIINYLLEKSRIPYQASQERNYHVFYQLIAGVELTNDFSKELKKQLKLRDAEEFTYMNQSGVTTVEGINDEKDWEEMVQAMDVLNMTHGEKTSVFRLVAAVLHMGNVELERDPKGQEETDSKIKNLEQLAVAAELFSVDKDNLAKALCYRKISRPGSKSVTYARNSIVRAKDVRDAMTKTLYGKLFDWLIGKINIALMQGIGAGGGKDLATIGVLDIFGFESFQTNSFEQLCINYCNEKLQQHFNSYIFKLEQEEYAREGVPVDMIEFKDNQPTLDLLEKPKGEGIFSMIDEEISVPKGSDETLLKKVLAKHAKHPQFGAPKPKDFNAHLVFIVHHYAGAVPYNVTAFLEKNKDSLNDDITEVINSSKDALVCRLLRLDEEEGAAASSAPAKGAPKKARTLGFQFKESLSGLMEALNKCEPHFVRCMKSNHQKKGNIFESDMMLAQLRYAGLLEVCRIRKIGFPVRKVFSDFVFRYRCLDLLSAGKGHVALCDALTAKKLLEPKQWVIGHTKVFMRNMQQMKLEEAREGSLLGVVTKMTKIAKGFICKRRYRKWKAILGTLRKAIATRTEEALEAALQEVPELPLGGGHLKLVKDARALKERLEEERRVTGLCAEAIKERDYAQLVGACKAADDIAFDSAVVQEAKALLALVEKERAAVKALRTAVENRSLPELAAALEAGAPFGKYVTDTEAYKQAALLKVRLEEEEAARKAVRDAQASATLDDFSALTAALAKMAEMGMDSEATYKEGAQRAEELEEQKKAVAALKEEIASKDLEPLQKALARCSKAGVPDSYPAVTEAKELEKVLIEQKEIEAELIASSEGSDLAAITKALAKADKRGMSDTPGVKKAKKRVERLQAEEAAREQMKKALKSNKAPTIASAMSAWNELGMDGPEMEAAREAMGKLGEQSKALLELESAVNDANIEEIDAAVAKLEKMGLGDEDQVKAAKDAKKRFKKQDGMAEELKAAIAGRSKSSVARLIEEGEAINFSKRYNSLVEEARALLSLLETEEAVLKAVKAAVESNDDDGIDEQEAKAKAAGAGERVTKAIEEARETLSARKALLRKLTEAVEAEPLDNELVQALVDEAKGAGLGDHPKVGQALNALNREKNLKETKKALKKAMKAADEGALAEALEKAVSLGIGGEEVEKARVFAKRLEEEKELAAGVKAVTKSLSVKADSKSGISAADLKPLDKAIAEAREQGLSEESPFLQQALQERERLERVVVVQADLAAAIEGDSLRTMKKVLDRAEDLDLGGSALVKKLKSRIKELEKARSKAAQEDEDAGEAVPSLDDEEMKKAREEKMRKASAGKYRFTNFGRIRNPDDFARGILLNKKKVKAAQLKWQPSVIPTSILDFQSKELAKTATRIHKDILGYCGDKSMSFPATLAQDILQKGLETTELVDEIYIQLCKHLSFNPRPESAIRGWQIMCMCVGTFPPSREFENFLINFILEHKDGSGAVGNYARYSLRRLEGIINSGPSGFVPNVEEISAYKERPPILATIELVDGTPLTEDLPITPDLNVAKVLDICNHFMELTDTRMQYFGVFVEDIEDPDAPKVDPDSEDAPPYAGLPRTPRPLQNENFMGDVVTVKVRQAQPFKFVYKRKIFLKQQDSPADDSIFERLVYQQAVDEVLRGNVPVDDDTEVATLAAQAMAVDLADDMADDADGLLEQNVLEYIPVPLRDAKEPEEWAELVLAQRDAALEADPEENQAKFVASVKDHPLYGTCFFHVKKHRFPEHMESYPEHVIVALNSEGLHFLNEDKETLASFGYADIYRWGGSSTQFSIIIWNPDTQDTDDVSMYTAQAADMASLILDYINAIMAANDN